MPSFSRRGWWEFAGDARCFEQSCQGFHALLLGEVVVPCGIGDEADAASVRRESAVGVVDAQVQAELGARGEHPVGLVGALA